MILISVPMFLGTRNPLVHIKNIYVCRPSWISKWLPAKLVKNHVFGHNWTSRADRDVFLISVPMFLGTRNPLVPTKSIYVYRPSWISKWLPICNFYLVAFCLSAHLETQLKTVHPCSKVSSIYMYCFSEEKKITPAILVLKMATTLTPC